MNSRYQTLFFGLVWFAVGGPLLQAGDYSTALSNTTLDAIDAGIPGFVGPDGEGKAVIVTGYDGNDDPIYANARNQLNPRFVDWASGVVEYQPSTTEISLPFADPTKALGAVTGDNFDVVALGDLNATEILSGAAPGFITLSFDYAIRNGEGADFAVFENGFASAGGAGVAGQLFAELAFVEVSTNGIDFARFPSLSFTGNTVGAYGTIDPTDVYNLAGKHANAYGDSWGTPFDLDSLLDDPDNVSLVTTGLLDLSNVNFVRIVDIPGDGSTTDSQGNPIYDGWYTWGSGGFDLDAIGVINNSLNTPIPEPATFALYASCLVGGLVAFQRRRFGRA